VSSIRRTDCPTANFSTTIGSLTLVPLWLQR
jgi:hypothetical protein